MPPKPSDKSPIRHRRRTNRNPPPVLPKREEYDAPSIKQEFSPGPASPVTIARQPPRHSAQSPPAPLSPPSRTFQGHQTHFPPSPPTAPRTPRWSNATSHGPHASLEDPLANFDFVPLHQGRSEPSRPASLDPLRDFDFVPLRAGSVGPLDEFDFEPLRTERTKRSSNRSPGPLDDFVFDALTPGSDQHRSGWNDRKRPRLMESEPGDTSKYSRR